jgi:hypothetical protein
MSGTRKIAAILAADIVGYSRLAGTDEDRTLSRLRGLRSDLIDPRHRRASRAHRQAHRRRQGLVTLPTKEHDGPAALEISSTRDCLAPRAHRRGAESAMR